MPESAARRSAALIVAIIAVMTAVTTVFTIAVKIPIPGTTGYVLLTDVAVFFTSFAIGPFAAAIAGGLGSAFGDIFLGGALWAPNSLLAHGLEGLLAGLIASAARSSPGASGGRRSVPLAWILGSVAGVLAMVVLYLLGGLLIEGPVTVRGIPWNLAQAVFGAIVGSGFAVVVRRAYPPVQNLRF